MRIVLVGASGNIGTALLGRLGAAGHTLTGIARRPPEDGPFSANVQWHAIDITARGAQVRLQEAMQGADSVVHLAWGFQPSHRPDYLRALDIGGSRRSLAAAFAASVPQFVHFSSVGAYSPASHEGQVDESWPTGGIPQHPYSRHKAAVERLLDAEDARRPARISIARIRPALVGNRASGSELLRYTYPKALPTMVLRHLPVVPLDRQFHVQLVHVLDLADAVARVIERRAEGAFNVAADGEVTAQDVAGALGAPHVHLPWTLLRALAAVAWHARLQPVEPGWLDLAALVPRMSSERARRELGWRPEHDAQAALAAAVDGMRSGASGATPALRPHTWLGGLEQTLRGGPVSYRRVP